MAHEALHASRVGLAATIFHDLALEDPHLHADGAEGRLRRRRRVVDVRPQRVQRYASLVIAFDARDLRAAQPAARLHLDALRAHAHRTLHRALHGATERDTLRQLVRDVVGNELRVELGTLDLLDVDPDFLPRDLRELVAKLVDLGTLLPDDDPRPAGVDRDHDLARLALDRDVGDRRVSEACLEILPQQLVLTKQRRAIPVRVPPRTPLFRDPETETKRIDFLTH